MARGAEAALPTTVPAAVHDGGEDAARLFGVALVFDFRGDVDGGRPRAAPRSSHTFPTARTCTG